MKPRRSKKTNSVLAGRTFVDIFEGIKPGETKEIEPGMWVITGGVILDPPEPFKKIDKAKPRKPKKK